MKQLIRQGVFETNSSSAHSVSIADETKEFVLDTLYPDQNGEILLNGGEFGWEWFKHNDALTKANYAAQSFNGNENHMEMLIDVIKEQTGAEDVLFDTENGYIDHDSYGTCPTNREELKSFIFNKNSWLFGGNDNTTPDPTFYIVPEYKDGRLILPEYKYELKIDGFAKTTKFIDYPDHEHIEDGLRALLEGVKLFDNNSTDTRDPKGFYFDEDDSIMAQLNRRDGYFEYSSWKHPIQMEEQIISFVRNAWQDAQMQYHRENPHPDKDDWQNGGYKRVREIEDELLALPNSPYRRQVHFSIKEIEKKGKK